MTKVKFLIGDNRLKGFEIKNHSGFASEGRDIVCSAISSASQMAANTITEIIGDKAEIEIDEAYLRVYVEEASQSTYDVLNGLKLHLIELSKQYPKFITIIYGGTKNA